jgi:SpoVK/Ycf46/Vps4 family AAA+-type ATPase
MVSDTDLATAWEKIILKPSVKQDLLGMIRAFNRVDEPVPKGLLLYGPPGTGKSLIGRCIGQSAGDGFMPIWIGLLKAPYVGQSGALVKKVWQEARARGRCVMFIDECEWVFPSRGGAHSDVVSEELIQAFLAEWDAAAREDQRVWVIGAADRKELLDDAIASRFGAQVETRLPEAAERLQILRVEMLKLERPAEIPEFVGQETVKFSGRDLSRLAGDVCVRAELNGETITAAFWSHELKRWLFRRFLHRYDTNCKADELAAELARCTDNVDGHAIGGIVERAACAAVKRAIALGAPDRAVVTREDLMCEATGKVNTPQ